MDVGCGSGQSTRILSPHFEEVIGLDISQAQVDNANKAASEANVKFQAGSGENLQNFKNQSVDLLTCCQAVHWLDFPVFYKEVDRVLKPKDGVVAIYGYHLTGPRPDSKGSKRIEELRDKVS